MEYLGLIGNVENSFLKVQFGNGFTTERMKLSDFVAICKNEFQIQGVEEKLEHDWGYRSHDGSDIPEYVYVVRKSLTDFPEADGVLKDIELYRQQWQAEEDYEEQVSAYVENKTRVLRLLNEGSVQLSCEYFYETANDGQRKLISCREQDQHGEDRLYKLNKKGLEQFSNIDYSELLNELPNYLKFAWNNFDQSYTIPHREVEFLCLMTSLEALLNDGSAVKCGIAKGTANLIGRNKHEAVKVFDTLTRFYDLQARLINSGDKRDITEDTVVELKNIVRRALVEAIELKLPKQDLSKLYIEDDSQNHLHH